MHLAGIWRDEGPTGGELNADQMLHRDLWERQKVKHLADLKADELHVFVRDMWTQAIEDATRWYADDIEEEAVAQEDG